MSQFERKTEGMGWQIADRKWRVILVLPAEYDLWVCTVMKVMVIEVDRGKATGVTSAVGVRVIHQRVI